MAEALAFGVAVGAATGVGKEVGRKAAGHAHRLFKDYTEIHPSKLPVPDPDPEPEQPLAEEFNTEERVTCTETLPWPLSALSPSPSSSPPEQKKKPEKVIKKVSNEYDMVLKIKSLEDVVNPEKGWNLKIESAQARKALAESSTIKIGIMGVYNRGKTTVTNLLSGRAANVGNLLHTEGLSAVLKDNVAYLDTAGQNQPLDLSGEDKTDFQERVAEQTNTKLLGDLFMQDMVVTLSDLLIVVVNQLTLEDQRYVRVLEKKVKEFEKITESTKKLIVIHNLKDVETKEDLDSLIKKDIIEGFGCTMKVFFGAAVAETQSKTKYRYWSSPSTVSHCVLARVGSQASIGVNAETIALITNLMQSTFCQTVAATTQKNLLQGIDAYVRRDLHNYFDKLQPDQCALCKNVVEKKDDSREVLTLFLDSTAWEEEEIPVIKKNAIVSEWQIIWGAQYTLDYDCLVSKEDSGAQVIVIVDLPGVFKGNPRAVIPEVGKDYFLHRYTWIEEGEKVLELVVRLASKKEKGPSVEVTAFRKQRECLTSFARTNDSGKRGIASLNVPKAQFMGMDAFADASVDIGENGTLRVTMVESGLATTDPTAKKESGLATTDPTAKKRTWGLTK